MSKFISLSGLKTLLEPLIHLINKKAERLDWDENDSSSPSYIKNRVCYEASEIKEALSFKNLPTKYVEEYDFSFYENYDGIQLNINPDKFYDITVNDITYNNVKFQLEVVNDSFSYYYIMTEDFYFEFVSEDYFLINFLGNVPSATISLIGEFTEVKKIDEKYLPQLIGKITEEGGEIFNDAYGASLGAHAEGSATYASGQSSHAEGYGTHSTGHYSHAEGLRTEATNSCSHAEGRETTASGEAAHAEGFGTIARTSYQHAEGMYNISDLDSIHITGNGTAAKRSNAHTLDWLGNAWFAGDVYVGSTSGTNKDSGSKMLATKEYVDNKVSTTTVTLSVPTTGWTENTTYSSYTQVFTVNGATTDSDIYIDCPVGANFPLIGARCLAANKITLYMSSIPTLTQNISIKLKKG